MSTTPSPIFNGSSRFASDFQQVITRAVAIASLPLNQLNSAKSAVEDEVNALSSIGTQFSALQTAIQNLNSVAGSSALAPTVSDPSVLTAQVGTGALAGTYSIHVVTPGSPTDLLSNNGLPTVSNPASQSISSASSFQLTIAGASGSPFTINPANNSLDALAQAINASGAPVSATVVNIGSPSSPDYRLALETTQLGNISVQLNDGSGNLINAISPGAQAQYQVNGQPSTPISSNTDTVTVAPGLTVNLLAAGDSTVTLGQSDSAISNGISSLVTAYNAIVDQLDQNHGSSGGPLTGQSIIFSLEQSLRNLTGFTGGSGSVQSLADLGLTFNDQGKLVFNQTQFNAVASTHASDLATFFGSATSSGFLQSATNILTSIQDPTTGTLQQTLSSFQDQINREDQAINAEQARVDALQTSLTNQITKADAAIAALEQQATLFTGLFAGFTNGSPLG